MMMGWEEAVLGKAGKQGGDWQHVRKKQSGAREVGRLRREV